MILENLCSVNSSTLVRPVNSSNFVLPVAICAVDSKEPLRPVDVRKPIPSVNSNKNLPTVNSNKPVNSKIVRPVDTRKPVCHINSSKPVLPIDVRKSVRPVNSNKPVYPVDVCKSGGPADVHKAVCLVDTSKLLFADYWKRVTLFLILLFFAVSTNTSVFNRIILYMILFTNIHVTYLIFDKSFKCTFVILIGYLLCIGDRLFKYFLFRDFHYLPVFF